MDSCVAYLDNNATTLMPQVVVNEMLRWVNQGNPSAAYPSAKKCQEMMTQFRQFIARVAGCENYDIVFTSCATEANCMICGGVIARAISARASPIHVICSAIEHKSILLLLHELSARYGEQLEITYVRPDSSGHIRARDFANAVRTNTVLATCMLANNETGAINDVAGIARAVKARAGARVFFHSDIVQGFGKVQFDIARANIDGASISFHKLHGPPGVGAAIIARGCAGRVCPILHGTQSHGMRGGTENIIGIGAAFAATRLVFASLEQTIAHELELKKYLVERLRASAPVVAFTEYDVTHPRLEMQVVLVGDETIFDPSRYLPATLMVAVAKHVGPSACNTMIKEKLEAARVIVSVGSACNTASAEHSHVLRAMNVPAIVMDGAIRVSMCAYTTRDEIDRFVIGFLREAERQRQTAHKGERAGKPRT